MGKSSVMNAIFGRKVVSSSATPGHTKHFQTFFLTRQLCFLDSPGIVCPKLDCGIELQVLFGSYKIAQLREPYSTVRFLAERCVPRLHEVYHLEDQRTGAAEPWSPLSLCEAYARREGFLFASGKPDAYRAANRLLRTVTAVQLSSLSPLHNSAELTSCGLLLPNFRISNILNL